MRMTEDRDKWRKYVHCVAINPQIEDGSGTEHRTEHVVANMCYISRGMILRKRFQTTKVNSRSLKVITVGVGAVL